MRRRRARAEAIGREGVAALLELALVPELVWYRDGRARADDSSELGDDLSRVRKFWQSERLPLCRVRVEPVLAVGALLARGCKAVLLADARVDRVCHDVISVDGSDSHVSNSTFVGT